MTTTITAADFETRYDAEHTFPFFESEDGRILGYGHPDRAWAAEQVWTYYAYTDPKGAEGHVVEPSDVHYRWAVPLEDTGATCFRWADPHTLAPYTEVTPGAFPVWTVAL